MTRLNIQNIIATLNATPSITALVGNRIFWGLPFLEVAGNSIAITEITDNIDLVESFSRLEFRFIGGDDKTTIKDLYDIERVVTQALLPCKAFSSFTAHKIILENNSAQGTDEKGRPLLIRDYTFFYLN